MRQPATNALNHAYESLYHGGVYGRLQHSSYVIYKVYYTVISIITFVVKAVLCCTLIDEQPGNHAQEYQGRVVGGLAAPSVLAFATQDMFLACIVHVTLLNSRGHLIN